MESPAPVQIYCALMEELKGRIAVVRRFTAGEVSLGTEQFNYECVALQLRKVLELIAFGSLCANKEAYASVHANFASHWKATQLLRDLAGVHPEFYPTPVRVGVAKSSGVRPLAAVTEPYLTKDDFAVLYDKCSQVAHTPNPFSPSPRAIDFVFSVAEWVERIQRLLDTHWLRLAGTSEVWVIQMAGGTDGRVHAAIAAPMPAS